MKGRRILTVGDLLTRALTDLNAIDWRDVLMAEPCVYCGGKAQGLDHIVARSLGGVDALAINRAPACTPCDSKKANTPMLQFLVSRRGLRIMPRTREPEVTAAMMKAKRKADERAARREMRRQYREMTETAFRANGTFGMKLVTAIKFATGAMDDEGNA